MKTRSQKRAEKRYGPKLAKHNSIGVAILLKKRIYGRQTIAWAVAVVAYMAGVASLAYGYWVGIPLAIMAAVLALQIGFYYADVLDHLDEYIAVFPDAKAKKVR